VGVEKFANLEGIVVRADYSMGIVIDKNYFENLDVRGKAVLVNTNWSAL
jgi:arylformamidase